LHFDVGGIYRAAVYARERRLARAPRRLHGHVCLCCSRTGLGRKQLEPDAQVYCAMNFHLIGVNHPSAPLELREGLAVLVGRLAEVVRMVVQQPGVDEGMVLSTCNRVEVLTSTRQGADLRGFLRNYFGLGADKLDSHVLDSHVYEYQKREAVRH